MESGERRVEFFRQECYRCEIVQSGEIGDLFGSNVTVKLYNRRIMDYVLRK